RTRNASKVAAPQIPSINVGDTPNVVSGFGIIGNAPAACNRSATRVVSGKAQAHVAAVVVQQLLQVAYAGIDILLWIEWVLQIQLACGLRHELHQSHGALA